MGYGQYLITRRGEEIEAGYMVEAECDSAGCTTLIHRGIDQLCGVTPGGDEYGCGDYCCDIHLHLAPEGEEGWRCTACTAGAALSALTRSIFDHANEEKS